MPYCIFINTLSYLIAHTIGRLIHEENSEDGIDKLFIASTVAIVRVYIVIRAKINYSLYIFLS